MTPPGNSVSARLRRWPRAVPDAAPRRRGSRLRAVALFAVPTLAILATTMVGVLALERTRVGGSAYGEIIANERLRGDVTPSPLRLDEVALATHDLVHLITVESPSAAAANAPARGELEDHIDELERAYNDQITFWADRLDPANPMTAVLLGQLDVTGQDFWRIYRDEVEPAYRNAVRTAAQPGAAREAALVTLETAHDHLSEALDAHEANVASFLEVSQRVAADDEAALRAQLSGYLDLLLLIAFVGLAVTIAGALYLKRTLTRPLQLLSGATRRADEELPKLVAMTLEMPPGAPAPKVAPLGVTDSTTDPAAGEVAEIVDGMRTLAVELAARCSHLRNDSAASVARIGRRNQTLLNRALRTLTQLEENETDPDALEGLLRLDHLVTRMRRNAESLLVLSTPEALRTWSDPVDVTDVVRGALSEIEAFDRVNVTWLGTARVEGNAAADLSHLLAELLENATTYSPPAAWVEIDGRFNGAAYLITITDSGIGMSPEELAAHNQALAKPALFDPLAISSLGLAVVGRIGARHGVRTTFSPGPDGGVTVTVALPLELLTGCELAQEDPGPAGGPPLDSTEFEHPEYEHPEYEHHEYEHPELEHHEYEHPELEHHEYEHPELEHHELEHHELEHHEYGVEPGHTAPLDIPAAAPLDITVLAPLDMPAAAPLDITVLEPRGADQVRRALADFQRGQMLAGREIAATATATDPTSRLSSE